MPSGRRDLFSTRELLCGAVIIAASLTVILAAPAVLGSTNPFTAADPSPSQASIADARPLGMDLGQP